MNKELLLALLGSFAVGGCADDKNKTLTITPDEQTDWLHADNITPELIDKLLAELAENPGPENLSPGATCYMMSAPPDRIDYICPECGGKTILPSVKWWDELDVLFNSRHSIKEVRKFGLNATLDERAFCRHCKTMMEDAPKTKDIYFNVTFNGKTARTKLEEYDVEKLRAFLHGELAWRGFHGWEHPLKPEIPRIRQLLGLD